MLTNFSQHLNNKEKEAFCLLREKKFLVDSKQEPSIRVALRSIRDFAKPFKKPDTEEIIWRYFEIDEKDFEVKKKEPEPKEILEKKEPILNIFDEYKRCDKPKEKKGKDYGTTRSSKKDEKLYDQIKDFIKQNSLELKDLVGFEYNEFTFL